MLRRADQAKSEAVNRYPFGDIGLNLELMLCVDALDASHFHMMPVPREPASRSLRNDFDPGYIAWGKVVSAENNLHDVRLSSSRCK
jgi:hypothetical protein